MYRKYFESVLQMSEKELVICRMYHPQADSINDLLDIVQSRLQIQPIIHGTDLVEGFTSAFSHQYECSDNLRPDATLLN